ncbi:MAG: penicillin-binding protein 2 [Alphaproteobacteria bacterium]|nr:penicillin-binding protein 2 [Alphaproteobacteria bacterium]
MKRDAAGQRVFTRRAILLGGGQLALLTALVGRMYQLQVLESEQYTVLAEENRINLRLLPPPRGRVLDRFGTELAANQQNYRVVLIAEQTGSVERTLEALGRIVPLGDYERSKILREAGRRRSFIPITVMENLSWDQFAAVNVNSPHLPGLHPEIGESRSYPRSQSTSHLIGYVAAPSEDDLNGDPVLQLPGFRVGKSGIERVHENTLRGRAGVSRVEVNAVGRVIRELSRRDGQPGGDVYVTIDAELQEFATKRLGEEAGSVVVVDVSTGDVLTLTSTPTYDPHVFNVGLTQRMWQNMQADQRTPLVNKAIAGQYPPGSTFKLVVSLAALESGMMTRDHVVSCPGHFDLGNARFHCWKKHGHGPLNMLQALEHSCDVYFYNVARRIGIERIGEMATRLGLGRATGIDLPAERKGLIPTREWKKAAFGEAWQPGETVITGIGQGYVLATPLQLAVMVARLANGGLAVTPRLSLPRGGAVDDADRAAEVPPSIGVSRSSLALVLDGMYRVSNSPSGTAFRARNPDKEFLIGGKTGTSQVRRITRQERATKIIKNEDLPWEERDHALFVAYAPVQEPRYAISVVIEHGGSGSAMAAPVARDVIREARRLELRRRANGVRTAGLPPRVPGEGG